MIKTIIGVALLTTMNLFAAKLSVAEIEKLPIQQFCGELNSSMPDVFKVSIDAFTIRDGKSSNCVDHSIAEWEELWSISKVYKFLFSFYSSIDEIENGTCIYKDIVKNAIKNKANNSSQMSTITGKSLRKCSEIK